MRFPAQEAADRIIRYEAHLSREFSRTLNELERVQRMRRESLRTASRTTLAGGRVGWIQARNKRSGRNRMLSKVAVVRPPRYPDNLVSNSFSRIRH